MNFEKAIIQRSLSNKIFCWVSSGSIFFENVNTSLVACVQSVHSYNSEFQEAKKSQQKPSRSNKRNCIRLRVFPFPYYFIRFPIQKMNWGASALVSRCHSSESSPESESFQVNATPSWELTSATCYEKLMWKLLLRRTKWKTERFRCFSWDVKLPEEGIWVEIGGFKAGSSASFCLFVRKANFCFLCAWCLKHFSVQWNSCLLSAKHFCGSMMKLFTKLIRIIPRSMLSNYGVGEWCWTCDWIMHELSRFSPFPRFCASNLHILTIRCLFSSLELRRKIFFKVSGNSNNNAVKKWHVK